MGFAAHREEGFVLGRPGSDLLSRVLRHSTIGAGEFNGRVRDGNGFGLPARTTRPAKDKGEEEARVRRADPQSPDHDPGTLTPGLCCRGGVVSFRAGASEARGARRAPRWALINESDQAERAISTGKLRTLLRFHTRPIDVVVFHGSSGRTRFEVGFPLRCLQRLSRPHIATLQCGWRHNRSTRGASIPVLSY